MDHQYSEKRLSSYGRLGILLACIGVLLAVDTMADLSFIYKLWPLITTILGIGFIGIYVRRSRRESAYISIGVYIICFSGLALYCSLTTWTALATLWPAFIAFMGLALVFGYYFGSRQPGMLLAGLLFLSLAILFFSIFALNQRLWWSIFILAGSSFLIFDKVRQS